MMNTHIMGSLHSVSEAFCKMLLPSLVAMNYQVFPFNFSRLLP